MLAISIGIAYWIFNDARQRGKSGIIWGILGFFFSLITLIVWLIVRPKTMSARCKTLKRAPLVHNRDVEHREPFAVLV